MSRESWMTKSEEMWCDEIQIAMLHIYYNQLAPHILKWAASRNKNKE